MKKAVTMCLAVLAGACLGWWLRPVPDDTPGERAPAKVRSAAVPIADRGEAGTLAGLRTRIRELEAALAAARAVPPPRAEGTNGAERAEGRGPRPPFDPRRNLAELKEKDPARYAQITNRMAQFRARRLTRLENRLDTLASVDVSGWSAAARKTHAAYQELLAKREELMEAMRPDGNENTTEAERKKNFEAMRALDREIRSSAQAERQQLLQETAKGFGLSGSDASALADTVRDVIEVTEDAGRHGGHGSPPPGPPPR